MSHPDDVAPATEQDSVRGSDNRAQPGAFETAPKFAPPADEAEPQPEEDE